MSYEEKNEKLKDIDIENLIWIIYLFIIFLSYYSNSLEKKYYIYNDNLSKEKYRSIIILIFSILIAIYFYFLKDSYDSYKKLSPHDSDKKKQLVTLSFISSLLIFISGAIFLYIAIKDEDLNVELAFN